MHLLTHCQTSSLSDLWCPAVDSLGHVGCRMVDLLLVCVVVHCWWRLLVSVIDFGVCAWFAASIRWVQALPTFLGGSLVGAADCCVAVSLLKGQLWQ